MLILLRLLDVVTVQPFDQTNKIMDCMIEGINETMAADPYDVLDRANLGYCQLI